MKHIIHRETGITVARLMGLVHHMDGMYVKVRWNDFTNSDVILQPIGRIFEDVPNMFVRLLDIPNTTPALPPKWRALLEIPESVVYPLGGL